MKLSLLALTLFITLSANKCKNEAAATHGTAALRETKWVFESLGGEALKMPDGREQPWLQLVGDQLTGFGGCNKLMGGYKMDGTALSFSGIGSTKMYCEGIQPTESAITGMLGKVDSYKMDGGLLKLMGGGNELAALKAQ